jgi:hypothetical protein
LGFIRGVSLGDVGVGATEEWVLGVIVGRETNERFVVRIPLCPDHKEEKMTLRRDKGWRNSLFWGCSQYLTGEVVSHLGIRRDLGTRNVRVLARG